LDQHDEVVEVCSDALALDPMNEKAWFRRGVANSKIGLLHEAEADLNQVFFRFFFELGFFPFSLVE